MCPSRRCVPASVTGCYSSTLQTRGHRFNLVRSVAAAVYGLGPSLTADWARSHALGRSSAALDQLDKLRPQALGWSTHRMHINCIIAVQCAGVRASPRVSTAVSGRNNNAGSRGAWEMRGKPDFAAMHACHVASSDLSLPHALHDTRIPQTNLVTKDRHSHLELENRNSIEAMSLSQNRSGQVIKKAIVHQPCSRRLFYSYTWLT